MFSLAKGARTVESNDDDAVIWPSEISPLSKPRALLQPDKKKLYDINRVAGPYTEASKVGFTITLAPTSYLILTLT